MAQPAGRKKVEGRSTQAAKPVAPEAAGLMSSAHGDPFYFEDSGGPGPVLFYIYGLGCSMAHWKYQRRFFAQPAAAGPSRYRQVCLDFRGHGQSPPLRPGARVTLTHIVEDIVALCEHRDIRAASFLGQSMGGAIVLQLARDYPHLVRSLVLLTSPVRDPGDTLPVQPLSRWLWRGVIGLERLAPWTLRQANRVNALLLGKPQLAMPLREFMRAKGFNPLLAQTADVDEYVQKLLAVDFSLFAAMASELSTFDAVRFASQIACPVLLIAGANDRIVPLKETQRLARHLPRGELAVIPHGSHCPHFDDPNLINDILSKFLADHA